MTSAGRSMRKQARQLAKRDGITEDAALNQLIGWHAQHIRRRGIAGAAFFSIAAFGLAAVALFVPISILDSEHAKWFAALGLVAIGANVAVGALAFRVKKRIGGKWGYVEIAGALVAAIAVAVQIVFGTKTDYGVLALAELGSLFGIVKGFDTIDKASAQEAKTE